MSEHDVQAEFDQWALDGRGEAMADGHQDFTSQALDRIPFGPDDRVLDVGCGIGWAVHLMGERGAGQGVGIDIAANMVARARRSPGTWFLAATATSLPFRDGAFTRVLSVESLYYYPDLDRALREIHRVCATGARFLAVIDLYSDNPGARHWVNVLEVRVHHLSAAQYGERFRAAGFHDVTTDQVVDRRPIREEGEFEPTRWFPDYESYRTYRELGALLVLGTA